MFLRFHKLAYLMEPDSLGKTNVYTAHWSLSGICTLSLARSLSETQIPPSGLCMLSLMGRFIRVGPVSLLIQVNCVSSHMHSQSFSKLSRYFRGMLRLLRGQLIVSMRACLLPKAFQVIIFFFEHVMLSKRLASKNRYMQKINNK